MVGEGLERLLEKAEDIKLAPEGVRLFRERYAVVAVEGSRLLPDVRQVLEDLSQRGIAMAVASNKPSRFSRAILEAKGVAGFFREIAGPGPDVPAKPRPDMLLRLMAGLGAHPSATVVVGDMEVDSAFARAAGCRAILVPTGSRTREELGGVDCDALIEGIGQLPNWLEKETGLLQTHLTPRPDCR
jgi:phosphoglycolate phosphatase